MPTHTPRLKPHSLALALATLLPSIAFAAGQDTSHRDRHLTELSSVQVTASPLQGDAESLARPVDVLAGERLDEQKAGTLGDTVAKLPGVQSTFFGPGVGRPIIRGQEGPRVARSEEHTSELQSQSNLVCRLLLEKKKKKSTRCHTRTL